MRILLIEDDKGTAQSIELILKSESINVYTTDLGEEGIDLGKLSTTTSFFSTSTCQTCRALKCCVVCAFPKSRRQH